MNHAEHIKQLRSCAETNRDEAAGFRKEAAKHQAQADTASSKAAECEEMASGWDRVADLLAEVAKDEAEQDRQIAEDAARYNRFTAPMLSGDTCVNCGRDFDYGDRRSPVGTFESSQLWAHRTCTDAPAADGVYVGEQLSSTPLAVAFGAAGTPGGAWEDPTVRRAVREEVAAQATDEYFDAAEAGDWDPADENDGGVM